MSKPPTTTSRWPIAVTPGSSRGTINGGPSLQCLVGASGRGADELHAASTSQSTDFIRPRIDPMAVSCVVSGVRHIVFLLLAPTATARADDDEDQYFASFPTKMFAAGLAGHGGRGKVGPEAGSGRGRARVRPRALGVPRDRQLRELVARCSNEMTTVYGNRWRGALGIRWLARQFIPVDELGVDLYLHGAGLSRYHWKDGKQTRPMSTSGWHGRAHVRAPRISVRLDLDLLFSRGRFGIRRRDGDRMVKLLATCCSR